MKDQNTSYANRSSMQGGSLRLRWILTHLLEKDNFRSSAGWAGWVFPVWTMIKKEEEEEEEAQMDQKLKGSVNVYEEWPSGIFLNI